MPNAGLPRGAAAWAKTSSAEAMIGPRPESPQGDSGLANNSDVTDAQTLAPVSMARCSS